MDRELLRLLVDPVDGNPLDLEWLDGPTGSEDGLLRGGGGRWYPIVDGIPRIVDGPLRADVIALVAERMARHAGRYPDSSGDVEVPDSDGSTAVIRRTAASFGFEWTTWSTLLPAYERNARFYFEPLGIDSLDGALLVDIGCGTGRHAHYAARWGARVVGLDLSPAIEVAKRNAGTDRTMFVQADLLHPPLARAAFDIAVSFGVLHHLPDPETGFRAVHRLVREGGRVSIYLYQSFEGQPIKRAGRVAFDAMRRVTTRLPHRVMHVAAYGLGGAFTIGFVAPVRLIRRIPATREAAAGMPFAMYADYPFRVIVNDQFDRFATPIENRYTRSEVEAWFTGAGLEDVVILGGAGWRAAGTVPLGTQASPVR
jgi:2-polyprenyl-3-methyl-5-hydroxy-6-metoxy-1,4-benzoquinol methylase